MKPELMCIQMTNGTSLEAMVSVEDGHIKLDAGWLSYRITPGSARQVCHRILEILSDGTEKGEINHTGQ